MKIQATSIAALTAILLSSTAFAADVYSGKDSMKDGGVAYKAVGTRGGFYIKGDLGIAEGNRDVNRTIDGEYGETHFDRKGADRQDVSTAEDADNTLDNVLYYDPKYVGGLSLLPDSDDFSSLTFGGEVSYLWEAPVRSVGFEVALGTTFYADSETSHRFDGVGGTYAGAKGAYYNYADPSAAIPGLTASGGVDVERDFDIDLLARAHFFTTDRLSLYAGAGVSFARASVSGHAAPDGGPIFGVTGIGIDETDWSVGYVLNAGLQYWLTDRITLGLDYTYKVHEFDVSKSSTFGGSATGTAPYLSVNDSAEVEDEIHAIKARLGIKLN